MRADSERAIFLGLALALALTAPALADPICADRPGKAFANCTAPQGKWQLETDLYDQTWDRSGGGMTVTTLYTNPTLKYGLTDRLDLEAAMVPYQTVRTRDGLTGQVDRASGPSDLTLQAKYALSPSISLMPFVTAPTATHGLGAGFSLGAEVWGDWDLERSGQAQASFDVMAAWIPPKRQELQFDMQVNLPLNRRTPDLQVVFGVARRF